MVFYELDLHTGARVFAMASMSRNMFAFFPLFRVESKTKRRDWYLGKEGNGGSSTQLKNAELW